MSRVFLRRRPSRRPWSEIVALLQPGLSDAYPDVAFSFGPPEEPTVNWEDGPSWTSVEAAVRRVVDWNVDFWSAGREVEATTVYLRRSFSDQAVAVAVVRYRGSRTRPFTSAEEAAREVLGNILDTDDPATSGYPVVDTLASMLVAADAGDPPAELTDPADVLSWKLTTLGYDKLWAVAWGGVR